MKFVVYLINHSWSCLTKTHGWCPCCIDQIGLQRLVKLDYILSSSINYSLSVQNIGGQRVGDDKGGNSGTKNQFFLPPDSNDMTRKACKSFLLSRGMANLCSATIHYFTAIYPSSSILKFIHSEKATKFCEISTNLTGST